jgi:CheY-like chemotaxis protein
LEAAPPFILAAISQWDHKQMSEKIVLLVEDNENDIVLTEMAFKKCQTDCRLLVTHDGIEALDFLFRRGSFAQRDLSQNPAIILLDLKLPFIDGFEVLRQIRADKSTRQIPVLVLTSSLEETDQAKSSELGANRYYRKPVSFDKFVELIQEICSEWLS